MSRLGGVLALVACMALAGGLASGNTNRSHAAKRHARVLLVGTYHHHRGRYKTIQAAVNAARPGDWILVGPGDYHERADHKRSGRPSGDDAGGGVYIAKAHIHLRGMNRNRVVVDGTKRGSPKCSKSQSAQDFGPAVEGGK